MLSCSGRVKGGLRAGLIDRAVEHVLSLHFTHAQEPQLFMPHKFSTVANPDLGSGIFLTPGSRIQPIFHELGNHFRFKNSFSFKSNPFLYLLRYSNYCLILWIYGHLPSVLLNETRGKLKFILFPPLFLFLDLGSRIRHKHLGSARIRKRSFPFVYFNLEKVVSLAYIGIHVTEHNCCSHLSGLQLREVRPAVPWPVRLDGSLREKRHLRQHNPRYRR